MKPFAATGPFSFVLFGASGNLAKLKIYPALYVLFLKKRFPKDFAIVGYSRSPMDERSFRLLVDESIHADLPEVNRQTLDAFLQHVHYQQGLYDSVEDFKNLRQKLESLETGSEQWVRLAYLSVPPTVLHPILQNLCAGGVHKKDAPFRINQG
jgi:glucose-6-phosphate 1-dehydrogenase